MCGIVGIVSAPGGPPPDLRVGTAMNAVLRHRGPDDDGTYHDARAFLGMRRLAIIDLAGGHQPMQNADGSVQLLFNGEIYNYRELHKELAARGHAFHTHSDSEVIVQAYEAWGEACFERLNGMFAIALWDTRTRTLLLARDRFGEKPLFFTDLGSHLAFASELKALMQIPEVRTELDPEALRGYMTFGYVPSPHCILRGVSKLKPAHFLRYVDGRASIHRYYSLEFSPKLVIDEPTATEELARLLDQAVASRLVSDVRFGAFLSGGLDSSIVVALIARHLTTPVKTFTIGFCEAGYNEIGDAQRVARHLGTEHHDLVVEPDAVGLIHDLVWHLDEPFADASALPTYLVSKLAREHVKMVLSGDGGDEVFAGYKRYRRFLRMQRLGLLKPLAARIAESGAALLPGRFRRRLSKIGESLRLPFPESYLSIVALSAADQARALGGPGAVRQTALAFAPCELPDGTLDRIVAIDFAGYLPDDILVKVDRMSMAHSLECRAPLLDHRLVDFAAKLPQDLRLRNGRGKYLLRKAARRWLPADVLKKKKQGFSVPVAAWLRGPLGEMVSDLFASRAFRERGLVDAAAARRCLSDHLAGVGDLSEVLWLVVCLELWAREFLDAPAALPQDQRARA